MISVIIPALDEANELNRLLGELSKQDFTDFEVIVSVPFRESGPLDGDPMRKVCLLYGANILYGKAGRGAQLSRGARSSSRPWMLFLHADTHLFKRDTLSLALKYIDRASGSGGRPVAGHFPLDFVTTGPKSPALHYYEAKTYLNFEENINGDQGLFIHRDFYWQIGGHDPKFPFLEDQDISQRIQKQGEWRCLPGRIGTSARRFESEGLGRRMALSGIIMGLRYVGVDDFFQQAPKLYRAQQGTSTLVLRPFFRMLAGLCFRHGLAQSLRWWRLVGRYLRLNVWQVGLLIDFLVHFVRYGKFRPERWRREKKPFLYFFRELFLPLTHHLLFDAMAAFLGILWFLLAWAWYEIHDPLIIREGERGLL